MAPRDERFAEFAWQATQSESVADTIRDIVRFAWDSVRADYAGITLIRAGGKLTSLGQTDGIVTRCDALQHQLGEGPCVDAALQARHITATDLSTETRWPRWSKQAVGLGIYSILSATMYTSGQQRLGSLNLYGNHRRQFDSEEMETARLFAVHATTALRSAIRLQSLEFAMESRTVIGQATGMLMEKYSVDADQAMAMLMDYSQDTNTKLRRIAEQVVEGSQLPKLHGPEQ